MPLPSPALRKYSKHAKFLGYAPDAMGSPPSKTASTLGRLSTQRAAASGGGLAVSRLLDETIATYHRPLRNAHIARSRGVRTATSLCFAADATSGLYFSAAPIGLLEVCNARSE